MVNFCEENELSGKKSVKNARGSVQQKCNLVHMFQS